MDELCVPVPVYIVGPVALLTNVPTEPDPPGPAEVLRTEPPPPDGPDNEVIYMLDPVPVPETTS